MYAKFLRGIEVNPIAPGTLESADVLEEHRPDLILRVTQISVDPLRSARNRAAAGNT